jgi:hypothetical protein
MSTRPYRATEILLQAEVELRPLLDGLEAGARRAIIADLTSIAVRLDGVDVAPLFGQTLGAAPDFAADRVVLERIAPKRPRSKKAYGADVAQHLPLSKGVGARSQKP